MAATNVGAGADEADGRVDGNGDAGAADPLGATIEGALDPVGAADADGCALAAVVLDGSGRVGWQLDMR